MWKGTLNKFSRLNVREGFIQVSVRKIRYEGGRPISISPDKAEELIGCKM